MPAHKGDTPERIKDAARAVFLQHGFRDASIQQIARAVGISAPGIYKHFASKDALFAALADPVVRGIREIMHLAEGEKDQLFEQGRTDEVWDKEATFRQTLDFIYAHFDDVKLVVCCAAGTKYERCVDRLADCEADIMLRTLPALRQKGLPVPEVGEETLRLMVRHQYRAYVEFIVNDYPRERAEAYISTVGEFYTAGWRALLGF